MGKYKRKILELLPPPKKLGFFNNSNELRAYWWSWEGNKNFGDILTPYLIEKITGKKPLLCSKYCMKEYYIVTGSILSHANKNAIIWGAGIIFRDQKVKRPKKIFAVRGPITRERLIELGYECPKVYGDPGLLLPKFYNPKTENKYKLGLIPHYMDYPKIKDKINSKDILVINVFDQVEKVIDNICSCKRTISSSLHGLIVSHAYGIPSIWAEFSNKLTGDGTKFKDYFLSVGIKPYKPLDFREEIPSEKELLKIINKVHNKPNIDTEKLWGTCPFRK